MQQAVHRHVCVVFLRSIKWAMVIEQENRVQKHIQGLAQGLVGSLYLVFSIFIQYYLRVAGYCSFCAQAVSAHFFRTRVFRRAPE